MAKSEYAKRAADARQLLRDLASLSERARRQGDEGTLALVARASRGDGAALIALRPALAGIRDGGGGVGSGGAPSKAEIERDVARAAVGGDVAIPLPIETQIWDRMSGDERAEVMRAVGIVLSNLNQPRGVAALRACTRHIRDHLDRYRFVLARLGPVTVSRSPRTKKRPERKSAGHLDREIGEVVARRGGDDGEMERVTRERVYEPLAEERVVHNKPVRVTLVAAVGPERVGAGLHERTQLRRRGCGPGPHQSWRDRRSPAGLAYAVGRGRPYVHHVWVDPEARGRGLSRVLFDAYRSEVSPELVVVGPFTKAGRAVAERAGAIIEE
jgi:GNAT superfamily N-acetyltransferase